MTTNNRAKLPKDTEQDILLPPADYHEHFPRPKLDRSQHKIDRPSGKKIQQLLSSHGRLRAESYEAIRYYKYSLDSDRKSTSLVGQTVSRRQETLAKPYIRLRRCKSGNDFFFFTERKQRWLLVDHSIDARWAGYVARRRRKIIWTTLYLGLYIQAHAFPGPPCHLGPYCQRDPFGKSITDCCRAT